MTFLEIRQRVAEIIGVDSTSTTTDANATMVNKLKEWVNARYRVICASRKWNWLLKDGIVQTTTEITTGTVTATTDVTTITFSSGPTPSVAGWFIQFSDSEDWYLISAHTATQTGATLANAFLGTTSSTLTYTLRKVYYTLPSDIGAILSVKQTRDDVKLRYISPRQLDNLIPDRDRTGEPEFYSIVGLDSSQLYKVEFYPVPNVRMNIIVRYYQVAAEMSADGDTPLIPEAFDEILVWDTLATYGFTWLDDTRLSSALAERNRLWDAMIKNDIQTENIAVRMPFDVAVVDSSNILRQVDLPIE